MLSISRNIRLCVRVSVCLLSVCSLLRYHLTVVLPPLPEVGYQIFFRDSESLGKINGKKGSNIWTFLFGSGLKSPRKKKVFFCWFCLGPPSYGYYPHRSRDALSPVCGIFTISFESDMWHVTNVTWHAASYTWHMTCNTWHSGGVEHCHKLSGF